MSTVEPLAAQPLPGPPGWTIRAWREADVPRLAALADDPAIASWMSDTWPMPYTEADARWWVNEGQHVGRDRGAQALAICLDNEPWGGAGLHPQTGFQRCNVEVGWWLAPAQWGQGVAAAAACWLIGRCWQLPSVHRIFAPIHAGNLRSMRVAEKAGMRLESVQPRSAYKQGRLIDRYLWACYRES